MEAVCRRLGVDEPRFVEVESKWRLTPDLMRPIHKHLLDRRGVRHLGTVVLLDQYLDSPRRALLRLGASLRLRYRNAASTVCLQYKGPGFQRHGLLFRSEFSTKKLVRLRLGGGALDVIRFTGIEVADLLARHVDPVMREAMRRHLGRHTLDRITEAPILCFYQKDKFAVKAGPVLLEPSLDRVFAFGVGPRGVHPLATFYEYENEIKAPRGALDAKIAHVGRLVEFDAKLAERFGLRRQPLDKYRRCASYLLSAAGGR